MNTPCIIRAVADIIYLEHMVMDKMHARARCVYPVNHRMRFFRDNMFRL